MNGEPRQQAEEEPEQPRRKSRRGFASMNPEKQREIARRGGRAAHEKGTAHEFTPEEAKEAGRKGGNTISRDRKHMADIGRKGGKATRGRPVVTRKEPYEELYDEPVEEPPNTPFR